MAFGRVRVFVSVLAMMLTVSVQSAVINFDDLSLGAESVWNGADGSGGFVSGAGHFQNNYTDWGYGAYSWDGWAYSNITNNTMAGVGNQFSAITGTGVDSANYGISGLSLDYMSGTYDALPSRLTFEEVQAPVSAYFTNTTYAYYSMKNGDSFAKKFGGKTGNDSDWFMLKITGKDAAGAVTGTVDFYLADFRSADNSKDYIVSDWQKVDLSGLGTVKTLEFTLLSSDNGNYGMNTPPYFAMDDLTVVPEPLSIVLMGVSALLVYRRRS